MTSEHLEPERLELTFKTLRSLSLTIKEVKMSQAHKKMLVSPSRKVSHLPFNCASTVGE